MCSKALLRLMMAVVMIVTSSGCGLNTGEDSTPAPPPAYSGSGFSCISKIPEHVEQYVFDRMAGEEVTSFVQCLQKAFTAFARLTRGREQEKYAPDEIRRFLETYFLKDRQITDGLLREFMVLKQTFIGGSVDHITRAELYTAVEFLEDLRKEALRLKPHLKTLNPVLARQMPVEHVAANIRDAYAALDESISVIGKRFQRGERDYPLSNLKSFIAEFRVFIKWQQGDPNRVITPDQWVEFIRVFKELTVSPEETEKIRARDWIPLMQSFSRWCLAYLEFEVGVREKPKFSGVGLQNVLHLAQSLFTLLEDAISRQKDLKVTMPQLVAFSSALKGVHWMPQGWRVESIEGALNALVGRVFGDPTIPNILRAPDGLSMRTLGRIKDSFYQWSYVQMNLDQMRTNQDPLTALDADVPNLQPGFTLKGVPDPQGVEETPDWLDFLEVKSKMRPLFPDGRASVIVAPLSSLRGEGVRHGFYNLSVMNLLRSVVTLIFRGYAADSVEKASWGSGLKREEMVAFYEDFREIGIDLGFVDPRNVNTGERVFIEGNLFTYSSNGLTPEMPDIRGKMSFAETMELLAFLWTGGNLGGSIYSSLKEVCAHGPKDQRGNPKLKRDCVRKALPQVFSDHAQSLPALRDYLGGLDKISLPAFMQNLLSTAFSPANSDKDWIEISEFSTLAVVAFYSEAVLTRFDVNEDGQLTNPELDRAAEIFRGFIKWLALAKMDRELSDSDAIGVFYYILIYRALPASFWDNAEVWRLANFGAGDVALDRHDLSKVFQVLISKLTENSTPRPTSDPAVETE